MPVTIDYILEIVKTECETASQSNRQFNSAHEGLAIIQEEFEELKAEVFKKRGERKMALMETEAVQLAAMAVRFLKDIIYY